MDAGRHVEIGELRQGDAAGAAQARQLLNVALGDGMYSIRGILSDAADPTAGVWLARRPDGAAGVGPSGVLAGALPPPRLRGGPDGRAVLRAGERRERLVVPGLRPALPVRGDALHAAARRGGRRRRTGARGRLTRPCRWVIMPMAAGASTGLGAGWPEKGPHLSTPLRRSTST